MIWPVLPHEAAATVPGRTTPVSSTTLTESSVPFLTRRINGLDHGWKPLTRPTAVTLTVGIAGVVEAALAPDDAPATGLGSDVEPCLDRSEVNAETAKATPMATTSATTAAISP